MNLGIGNLENTSLPIGGKNTHSVLTGHTGLVRGKMFDDIDKLKIEDKFYINTLNQVLIYQIDQIKITEADYRTYIQIEDNQDYITLVTCTPYGINTHRLLVRGKRIEDDISLELNNDLGVKESENDIIHFNSEILEIKGLLVKYIIEIMLTVFSIFFIILKMRK